MISFVVAFELPECAPTCREGGTTGCYGCPDWGYAMDPFAVGLADGTVILPTASREAAPVVAKSDGGLGGAGTDGGILTKATTGDSNTRPNVIPSDGNIPLPARTLVVVILVIVLGHMLG
ncbi:hypothetical protein H257_08989 [Aphanomyces astaci]|uniref:Uncharacterized protein n=1 Tax=Aphanomyces astaci TaxID=112090 RepID=W4GBP7_APHAT|nr:hypothetical protein H257_08989 [Aphanomyces astaci]ETV77092.1 hypothetical protein H257_08989 [Aphanomyces astaci]KAF0717056.1 hypothetical protein AaE_010939 [Aphanomyces astaci]|eukprot:XP_009833398.1 hypothetical protein H257_08989 [Aphanomyces astaci]